MADQIVKLTFSAPVHFGERRLTDGMYSCDAATLFSALYIEALHAGCADELLRAAKSGDLQLSDAFPYIGKQLYIPKPMVGIASPTSNQAKATDSRERKANKKLKYIPLESLSDYLAGDFDFVSALEQFDLGTSFAQTKVNLTRENRDESEPYHVGAFRFNPECGIYFVVRGSYDIAPLFEQLGYSGIGGKRTSGYGRFAARFEDAGAFSANLIAGATGKAMLLSSSLPKEEELTDDLLENAKFHLARKGGFVQSTTHADTFRKKRDTWVFAPGSVFERGFEGDVFDVNATPGSHPVYRYARAMWMEV